MIRTDHFAELLLGGRFFRETETRAVAARTRSAVGILPPRAFGYRFYDVPVVGATRDDGVRIELRGDPTNRSGVYYVGGRVFTLAEVEARSGAPFDILAWHMRANCWARVVQTHLGEFQPFEPGDAVLEALDAHAA